MGQRKNAENKLKTRKKHSKNTKTGQKSTEKCLLQEFFDAQKALCSKRFRDFGGMLKSLGKSRKNLGPLVQMQQKTRSKPIVSNVFFVKIGGEEGIRTLVRLLSNGFQVYASIVYLPSYSPAQYRKNQGYTMASRTK